MDSRLITISDSGKVDIPTTVSMRDFEIANLLGTTLQFVRGAIKRLLKTRMGLDCQGGIVSGNTVIPEYFGLDVVIATAFQVDSYEADFLRKHIISKVTKCDLRAGTMLINLSSSQIPN